MSMFPLPIPRETPIARLSTLTVSLRLRLLVVAMLAILLCSAVLFWLTRITHANDRALHQQVETTLDAMRIANQAKDDLSTLRRRMAMSATTEAQGAEATIAMQAVIDANRPPVDASVLALLAVDPIAAGSLRASSEALSQTALRAIEALNDGDSVTASARFRQFPQLSSPAEDALDKLLARQQQELRLIVKTNQASQSFSQLLSSILHGLLVALAALSALILFKALFRPLQRLYEALRSMGRGEMLDAPPVIGNDEFGQLGGALYSLSTLTSELKTVAYQDALTQLPNRTQFEHDLTSALTCKQPFALLFADIDHFRTINDGYGHGFGDEVLQIVARQLLSLTKDHSRLYRYSGDLFALVIHSSSHFPAEHLRDAIAVQAEHLRVCMSAPLIVSGRQLPLRLSFGISLTPDDGLTAEAIVSAADAAMYQAKQLGRNVVQFARSDYAAKARRRLELADELRTALQTGALSPHFQPIVDLGSGSVVCAEALARWKHPTRGYVPPDEFIGIAEESGQIDVLTEQLLRKACVAAVDWPSMQGHGVPRLAFNLSARQVRQGVVEMVSTILAETGFPASRLEIEITESAIIERPETAERLLRELKALGVSVALDDFGTGYSSLSYLLRFPIDKIKVDRSFVQELGGQKQAGRIVAATISLAANLEILLVAEGVENVGQMVMLYELGCRQQQGWLFAKALSAEDFSRWALTAPLRLDAVVHAQTEASNDLQSAA